MPMSIEERVRFRAWLTARGYADLTAKTLAYAAHHATGRGVVTLDDVARIWQNYSCGRRQQIREALGLLDEFRGAMA